MIIMIIDNRIAVYRKVWGIPFMSIRMSDLTIDTEDSI